MKQFIIKMLSRYKGKMHSETIGDLLKKKKAFVLDASKITDDAVELVIH